MRQRDVRTLLSLAPLRLSSASIAAALYPDSTDFLYFVAQPDGRHRFSATYAEHVQAIGRIRGKGGEEEELGRRD